MPFFTFTVDSRLLEELGERLVGKSYIALAELVKNSYDADATEVTIEIDPAHNRISVSDNGQGMTLEEFENYWMRIGSRHREEQKVSKSLRGFHRHLTGSKGIGRLAVQYLARGLELSTTSEKTKTRRIDAKILWDTAVRAGELTKARVDYVIKTSKEFPIGTTITLTGLRQKWKKKEIQGLAKEIWWLRPPFRRQSSPVGQTASDFDVKFVSSEPEFAKTFEQQMNAILDIWYAKLVGRNEQGEVNLSLQFDDDDPIVDRYPIPLPCNLEGGDFEIRIYKLQGRPHYGIKVGEARSYLNEFGGIHVYDGGFHLPYYGIPENDWLKIEFDHSHRLSTSQLLPKKYQVTDGMTFLPTLSRTLGVVNVDTSREPELKIAITRDRFREVPAFANLIMMIRYAMDFYAVHEAAKSHEPLVEAKKAETESLKSRSLEDVLEKHREKIPGETYDELRVELHEVSDEIESAAELTAQKVSIVGPLATAGINSIAYQHELKQQLAVFDEILVKIDSIRKQLRDERVVKALDELKRDLLLWEQRTKMTNTLFAYFRDAENMQTRERFPARNVVDEIWAQVKFLARGADVRTSRVEETLVLPRASLLEWGSIFQNVFINAFNALLDSKEKLIDVSSRRSDAQCEILVQDTGVGVDLRSSETLFEPFARRMKLSPERRAMGYGGTGLGLTIVRLIAQNIGATVSFIEPEKGFRTAFSIRWRERE